MPGTAGQVRELAVALTRLLPPAVVLQVGRPGAQVRLELCREDAHLDVQWIGVVAEGPAQGIRVWAEQDVAGLDGDDLDDRANRDRTGQLKEELADFADALTDAWERYWQPDQDGLGCTTELARWALVALTFCEVLVNQHEYTWLDGRHSRDQLRAALCQLAVTGLPAGQQRQAGRLLADDWPSNPADLLVALEAAHLPR